MVSNLAILLGYLLVVQTVAKLVPRTDRWLASCSVVRTAALKAALKVYQKVVYLAVERAAY